MPILKPTSNFDQKKNTHLKFDPKKKTHDELFYAQEKIIYSNWQIKKKKKR